MAFHGKFRLKLVQLLKNHAFPSSAVDGRLGGDVVVDHKYKYGAGFRLGFIAAHRGETMVFFRTSARQHAQPSGWNTFGKRIILSPTSSKFHSGHGTETWSVSQKRAFKVHVLYDSNCSRVSTVCVWISAWFCAVIDRALKFKKVSRNLRSSPCDAMFETGWIGRIGLHSVGRQAESAWLTQIFCWKKPVRVWKIYDLSMICRQ